MRKITVEIGFDWSAGNLGPTFSDEKGSFVRPGFQLFPLQLGFVRLAGGEGSPIWPTQLEEGDELSFKIFDTDRTPPKPGSPTPQPELFHAYFQDLNDPERTREFFVDQPTPVEADLTGTEERCRLVPVVGTGTSHYFGAPERAFGQPRSFSSWQVLDPRGQELRCRLAPKRPGRHLDSALMALALRVRWGRETRDFAIDPEVYVGPYINDPPPTEDS